jgi:Glycosyl hydrolases family 35
VRGVPLQRRLAALAAVCAAFATAFAMAPPWRAAAKGQNTQTPAEKNPTGVEIVEHGSYPELRVDGAPFFIHSAAFFYYRVPRDLWELSLDRYRAAGINTVDIYIPWNWHEPAEGAIDFDGHTNPRRDLRALLRMIAQKKFRLIARPGPEILNEWRNGGYPDWLLSRPEYHMEAADILEGRYPPLDSVNAHDAEAAARGWLANETHMRFAREWLTAVAKELAPYSSRRLPIATPPSSTEPLTAGMAADTDASGPLLFVQLGDDFAIGRTNRTGAEFWSYVDDLRAAVEAGGVDVPVFINPTDMRVSAEGASLEPPIGVMGQWYLRSPPARPADASAETKTPAAARLLTGRDVSDIEFVAEELKTQPAFPPAIIEYQAGWYAPADDDRPAESPPENTVLSSRLLLANGIHGISYFPLQDTYTPAGFSVPWANRADLWDAAFGPDAERQPRLRSVQRNGLFLNEWGPRLAASHKRADLGIVYPIGAYPQEQLQQDDIRRVSESVMRIERLANLALLSSELVDPEYQPLDQLLRDPLLFLPTLDAEAPQFALSETAQRALVEYVRGGGTLVVFPVRPQGAVIQELFDPPVPPGPASENSAMRGHWKFGEGEVIESSKDFFSWVPLDESLSGDHERPESQWAIRALREIVISGKVRPSVRLADKIVGSKDVIVSEIVTNEGTSPLGVRAGGQGLLSVTNLSPDEWGELSLEALPPDASSRAMPADYLPVHVTVPPRESMMLPLQVPLCAAARPGSPCDDQIIAAGAEFLGAQREGKTLELLFYVPARAEVRLRLDKQPSHVLLEETQSEASWTQWNKELDVVIPRGAAPRFIRTLKVELGYKPAVPDVPKPGKPSPEDFDFFVANALRLPIGGHSFLRTYPPLLLLESDRPATILIQAENRDTFNTRDGVISVDGDLRGGALMRIAAPGIAIEKVRIRPNDKVNPTLVPGRDGFLHATVQIRTGKDERTLPVLFLKPRDEGATAYRYDFDRDGADEWVLENSTLRLIVSPESGGQAIAFIDKSSGASLSTSAGLLRDAFSYTPNPSGSENRPRGRWGLFNRPYLPEWSGDSANPVLKLRYSAPDIFPAGASIQKAVQLEDEKTLRVEYEVALGTPPDGSVTVNQPQAFVVLNSFPAVASAEHSSRFCWQSAPDGHTEEAHKAETQESPNAHCENFIPGGKEIEVPAGTNRVEVRTPGGSVTGLEWECTGECARMIIEPKNFSALFHLQFPPLAPGSQTSHYTVRIRALARP